MAISCMQIFPSSVHIGTLYIMVTLSQLLEPITDSNQHDFCVEMMKRLNILRNNDNCCDVTLEVGSGEEQARLKAHRIVLSAASPFFYNVLKNDMKEKKEGVIRLQETVSKSVMEDVLDYFYTGHVKVRTEDALYDLMAIADYFLLPNLKSLSGKFVLQNMSNSNCILAYYFAVKYRCDELEEGARGFIHTNFAAVKESEDFLSLESKQVEEWISSDEIVVDGEEVVFEAILKWIERDENMRKHHFFDLFRHVRCVHVSRDYLFEVILKNRFVKDVKECMDLVHDAMKLMCHATDDCLHFVQLPRNCLKTHENAIVACGGEKALCYIPSQNKWYELPGMLTERECGHGVCTCRGKLYVVGGHEQGDYGAERYDPSVNSWAPIAAPKDVVMFAAVVAFQGFVYAIGGVLNFNMQSRRTLTDTVQRYNPDTNSWQLMAPLSGVRTGVCAVANGNYLYAIGGTGHIDQEYLKTVERFDSKTNSWTRIASTVEKRTDACGASVDGKVFVIGGFCNYQTEEVTNSCEVYDPVSEAWSKIECTTFPRSFAGAVNFLGKVVVFGGVSLFEVYDVEKNKWKTWTQVESFDEEMKISCLRLLKSSLVKEIGFLQ